MQRDTISIQGLEVQCIVGAYPHERDTPQTLVVDVTLGVSTEEVARTEKLVSTVDYAAITGQITFLLEAGRFRLLETAAHTLAAFLLAPPAPGEHRAAIYNARVRLTKPAALPSGAVPTLEIARDREWLTMAQERKPFGTVDIVHETRDVGIYRLNIAPHKSIPLHHHRVMQESEMLLSDGLLCQGLPRKSGTIFRWPNHLAHRYDNPTDIFQTVLCVDSPPFIERDEIEVSGEPGHIDADLRFVRPEEVR